MQRTLNVLAALLTILTLGLCPALAQDIFKETPAHPSAAPQAIDDPASADGSTAEASGDANDEEDHASEHLALKGALTVAAGETRDNVSVCHRPLVIAGSIKHDVLAVESDVTIKRGAKVGGTVVAIGGNVTNEAGDSVHIARQSADVLPALQDSLSTPFAAFSGNTPGWRWPFKRQPGAEETQKQAPVSATPPAKPFGVESIRQSWSGSQWAMLFLGLIGGLILVIAAPRAAQQCATLVGLEPARCLIIGAVGAVVGLIVSVVNAALMHSPLGLIYAPLGAIVALVPLLILACGWLCGMRFVGDTAARMSGRHDRGHAFTRLALGLGIFFVVKLILGGISSTLGAVCLTVEFIVALLGVGAILISGFGKDPDWLGARLRGQSPWFPGTHRS